MSRSSVHNHRAHLRLSRKFFLVVIGFGILCSLFCIVAIRRDAHAFLTAAVLREWILISTVLIVIGIAMAGMYSVMVDFVFWEGWLKGLPDPRKLFSETQHKPPEHHTYVVYLDGIHQTEQDHPPRVSQFLALLEKQIEQGYLLVRGIEAYTITPVSLSSDRYSQWFWQRLFALQEHHPNGFVRFLCSLCVQVNNVIKVGISSDRRYGPVMNYELALKIAHRLESLGFQPGRASRIALVGYSGGGEMAIGTAEMLQRICRVPVQVITVCGVFSGNGELSEINRVATIVGSRDPVAAFGQIAYPGRLPLLPFSKWNRWRRSRPLQRYTINGMNHNGATGPFSDLFSPDVVKTICQELASSAIN
ncbi:MAG: alpha/beta hydrolase [Prochlorococcus sp.]